MKSQNQEGNFRQSTALLLVVFFSVFCLLGIAHADCMGGVGTDDIVIRNKAADYYIYGDVVDCAATGSITLGPFVTIPDGATFILDAPQVTVNENVAVLSGGVVAVGPYEAVDSSDCVDSATVDCKGPLTQWPAGSLVGVRIGAGVTHVYYFDYVKAVNDVGSFMAFDGQLKVVSVSLNADDFSLAFPCQITQVGLQHALRYGPSGEEWFGECPLEDGKRYYLNIKSTVSGNDSYSLTVR